MGNSGLVDYIKISPNKSSPRKHKIDTITIHHMAGNLSVETCGNVFASASRQASSNYGIGSDGRIGMYVEEKDRSWCSSSASNDHRAITIEVANNSGGPDWTVSDKAIASLINLCEDICRRNDIPKLLWKNDKSLVGQVDKQNITIHNWFAATTCPGPYLTQKIPFVVDEVNKRLNPSKPKPVSTGIKEGDLVAIKKGATYFSGKSIPAWVMNDQWYVSSLPKGSDRAVLGQNKSKTNNIQSPINIKNLTVVSATPTPAPTPISTPSVVKEKDWVTINQGATYYNGKTIPSWVMADTWQVTSLPKGSDRAVLGPNKNGKNNIQSPINTKFLTVVDAPPAPTPVPFTPYLVKVTVDALNYRSGPGTNYKINGTIRDKGTYTIVEESNGWGKLKSGAGWINLSYTRKV